MDRDLIFLTDIRGSTPLNYVKKDNNEAWIEFLKEEMDHHWPADGDAESKTRAPPLALQEPGSQPLPDQITNLGLDVIALMATGQLSATDPRILMAVRPADGAMWATADAHTKSTLQDGSERTVKTEVADDSEVEYSDYDSDDSDYDSDYDSDEERAFNDGDLDEIIMIGSQRQ